jgi:uncharacterized protein YbjT (DUF2867 family)
VLLTGATGYVGGRLVPLLEQGRVVLRCLARKPDQLRSLTKESTQIVQGDVLDAISHTKALEVFNIRPLSVKEAIQKASVTTT